MENTYDPDVVKTTPNAPCHKPFVYDLFLAQRTEELELAHLPPRQRQPILDMQFRAHEQHHAHAYPVVRDQIILVKTEPVGRVIQGFSGNRMILADICIQKQRRGKGIAGTVIRRFQKEAGKENMEMTLTVYKWNPAVGIYRHLGFKVAGENEIMLLMSWLPDSVSM